MNLNRWILVYLATGSTFTRRALLAYYGGGLIVIVVAVLTTAFILTDGLTALLH